VGGVNLVDVMDEIARELGTIEGLRAYPWPVTNPSPPCAIGLFPESYKYDETYGRGVDRMTLQFTLMVGRTSERSARDLLGSFMDGSGPKSVKRVLEAGQYNSFDTIRVTQVDVDVFTMASVDYWGATFDMDILGPGSR
jgi:hypothetical protein